MFADLFVNVSSGFPRFCYYFLCGVFEGCEAHNYVAFFFNPPRRDNPKQKLKIGPAGVCFAVQVVGHISSTGDWPEFLASLFTLMSFSVIGFSLLFWLWKTDNAFSLRYAFISVQVPFNHPANTFAFFILFRFYLLCE